MWVKVDYMDSNQTRKLCKVVEQYFIEIKSKLNITNGLFNWGKLLNHMVQNFVGTNYNNFKIIIS